MGFDYRDIRRSMDVYTLDNHYLGTVLEIIPGDEPFPEDVLPAARQTSEVNGELLGPMPTQTIGNRGPTTQSARASYATKPDNARPIAGGTLKVGRWWGLKGSQLIPLDAILAVSLERVVLRLTQEALQSLHRGRGESKDGGKSH